MFVIVRDRREWRNEKGEEVREFGSVVATGVDATDVAAAAAAAVAVEVRVLVAADVIDFKGDGEFDTKATACKIVPVTAELDT